MNSQVIIVFFVLLSACSSQNNISQDYIDGYAYGCNSCRYGKEKLYEYVNDDYLSGYNDACYECSTRQKIVFKDEEEKKSWENTWEKVKK